MKNETCKFKKRENDVLILGIETSCDETAAAVVLNGREILSNEIYSQIDIHTLYGGVVPEIASRSHIEKISGVIDSSLEKAGVTFRDIDGIAVTYGPGLVGALLVGVNYAKALAYAIGKKFIPVHHIESHISANYIEFKDLKPPFLSLIVSGGHTHLINVLDYNRYEVIGRTKDDAVGEAYDKVSRVLGLSYPGGPKLDKLSKLGEKTVAFPKASMGNSYDFSFSGVKSAVLNHVNKCKMKDEDFKIEDIACSFQESVVDVLTSKTVDCILELRNSSAYNKIVLAGGVACNTRLRERMQELCLQNDIEFFVPSPILCTDNGAMVASRGYYAYLSGDFGELDTNAVSSLPVGS